MPPETVHPGKPCLRSSAPTALAYRPTRRSVALQEGKLAIGCVQCDHVMPSSTSRSRTSPRSEAARALVTLSSKPRRHAAVTQEYQADYDGTRLQCENLYSVEPTRHAAMQYRVPGLEQLETQLGLLCVDSAMKVSSATQLTWHAHATRRVAVAGVYIFLQLHNQDFVSM